MSDRHSKLIPVNEEANHQIVHGRRFGKADRAPHEPLDSGPQLDVFTLNSRRVLLANLMLRWVNMPCIRSPSVGVKARDPTGLQEVLQCKKDGILATSKDLRQHGPTRVIDGMPSPPRLRFLAHITPHLIAF